MAEITASMVKELRERSGAGMMECKKALTQNNGDMDASIEWLRKQGLAKADKKAGRVADFLEFGELMCLDALQREESCGGHFRTEYQTPDGEALRDDDNYCYVAAWEYQGQGKAPKLNREALEFENVHLSTRSYK